MALRIYPSAHAAAAATQHTAVRPLTWHPTELLLSRFAFGPTEYTRRWVHAHGVDAWWAQQVSFSRRASVYAGNPRVAKAGPLLALSPAQVDATLTRANRKYGWDALDQLTMVTVGMQMWSFGQLYETIVDFFGNHLNVPTHNGDLWSTRHTMDRDVVRRHAFGTFTNMLLAAARNPAMMIFLNNAESTKAAVNENYGRELLELHTVGLTYSESDVKNSARVLTGRTVDWETGRFVYRPEIHDTKPIKVLGFSHRNPSAAGGLAVGDAYLRYLATHPNTARLLARKLCLHYVSDTPSAALVSAVARAYLANHTSILPTISTIFRSNEFWSSRGRKVRRPVENLLASARTLTVRPADYAKALQSFNWLTNSLGQRPLDWAPPNGYPDVAAAWRSSGTMLNVWQAQNGLAGSWYDGLRKLDLATLYGTAKPRTSGAAIDLLTRRITGQGWSASHRAVLQKFLGESASTPMAKSKLAWMLNPVVCLILHSPHHALR